MAGLRPGHPRLLPYAKTWMPGTRPGMTSETTKTASLKQACRLMLALEPADMLLGIKLETDPPDQIELGFEEVDVMLLVLHQAFEQVARDVVLDAVAVGRRFLV